MKHGDIDLVGHINLNRSMDVAAEKFIRLVEVLGRAGVSSTSAVASTPGEFCGSTVVPWPSGPKTMPV
jgi:hypothetical protein